jgi:hypothetical protein
MYAHNTAVYVDPQLTRKNNTLHAVVLPSHTPVLPDAYTAKVHTQQISQTAHCGPERPENQRLNGLQFSKQQNWPAKGPASPQTVQYVWNAQNSPKQCQIQVLLPPLSPSPNLAPSALLLPPLTSATRVSSTPNIQLPDAYVLWIDKSLTCLD